MSSLDPQVSKSEIQDPKSEIPLRPELRPLEIVPIGRKEGLLFTLRDPEGFGRMVVMPYGAVLLAALMDGQHTLAEIQVAFQKQTGVPAPLADLERIIRRLDEAYLLAGERFDGYRREQIEAYRNNPVRPAAHAGGAYADDPQTLREQLAGLFTCDGGPGAPSSAPLPGGPRLCGLLSPHIDPRRGGPAFAWAYKQVAERCDADLLVIFGTAHNPMQQLFCVSRKDFDTPLGVVRTDRQFVDRLARHLASSVAGQQMDLFEDELVHRCEHSIEFEAVFLQYVLGGRREFRIVPVLIGSFQEFLADGQQPDESPEVQAFLAALRAAAEEHAGSVCYIAGADFAHIGQRFGDEWLLDGQRLAQQSAEDHRLLEAVCRGDADGLFAQVAQQEDRARICGLSPTYVMLKAMGQNRGELLNYGQAVEPDGTACVSFASVAFYRD
jgi:hypothetical protein